MARWFKLRIRIPSPLLDVEEEHLLLTTVAVVRLSSPREMSEELWICRGLGVPRDPHDSSEGAKEGGISLVVGQDQFDLVLFLILVLPDLEAPEVFPR